MELNGTELDKERGRNESEERWKERKEDESKYQLPMSKFTRILVR